MTLICVFLVLLLGPGCSVRKFAINKIGDALASGNSVYETDEDLELVGAALPFGLKFIEGLLEESPKHRGLLSIACQGFVLYSYAYVDHEAEVAEQEDLDRARALRARARRLYLRALQYGLRGLELSYPGFGNSLLRDPQATVATVEEKKKKRDLPFLYWSAAALGLAISVSLNDAQMLVRLPEVEALLDRALEMDESWEEGALHQFKIQLVSSKVGRLDEKRIREHYQRALALSDGKNAGLHLAYAEAVSIPNQDSAEFRRLVERTLVVDPDDNPEHRLVNLLAQRRARWLLSRIDELILEDESQPTEGEGE